jgi:HlyD family secretion protein
MKLGRKPLLATVVFSALALAALAWYRARTEAQGPLFRTAQVQRGTLLATISATGTLEPEEVIDVGAQVAGQISAFGKDTTGKPVDYGSVVEEGTVLAQIDDSLYAADVAVARAQVEQARAGLLRANADLEQLKAKLSQAERDWERARKLGPSEALAESSYDAYRFAYETARAQYSVGQAALAQARSSLSQAEASLRRAERNLGYCTIRSPVKGVIIDRRVNIGQTVVASLNAPSLFLIAKDLTRMQLWVSVNEADIGNIHPGQKATFTVDAFPGEVFTGEVSKVRLNATMAQNVVTYTVEVSTDNRSGRLLPYLTANVKFELSRRDNVLLAPNAALRWYPRAEQMAPEIRKASQEAGGLQHAGRSSPPERAEAGNIQGRTGILWVRKGAFVRPVAVTVGLTDGTNTEVEGEEVKEGLEVIVGELPKAATANSGGEARSPFAPQLPRGGPPPVRH